MSCYEAIDDHFTVVVHYFGQSTFPLIRGNNSSKTTRNESLIIELN